MTNPTVVQAQLPTQPPIPPTTGVFVILTPKPGATFEKIIAVMPAEIRATTQLYLDGKIRDWYSRGDGRGVIFLLNTTDPAEAHTIMDGLPLAKEHLMDHEYIPSVPSCRSACSSLIPRPNNKPAHLRRMPLSTLQNGGKPHNQHSNNHLQPTKNLPISFTPVGKI